MRAFLGVLLAVTGGANSTVPVEPPPHLTYIPVVQVVSKTPADARDSLVLSWHSSAANSVAFALLPGQGVCAHFDPAAADTTTTFSLTLRALRYEDQPATSITRDWSVKLGTPFWTVADSAGQVTRGRPNTSAS
ncbi:MAG TPA: hypothetical protein VM736_05815 [Gemmatimonadales bacterium]|nr:hypothetical protein [Gemmatimonadales bacterium]